MGKTFLYERKTNKSNLSAQKNSEEKDKNTRFNASIVYLLGFFPVIMHVLQQKPPSGVFKALAKGGNADIAGQITSRFNQAIADEVFSFLQVTSYGL